MKEYYFKYVYFFMVFIITIFVTGCHQSETSSTSFFTSEITPVKTTEELILPYKGEVHYSLVVEGFEWGPSVTKMIISLDEEIKSTEMSIDKFVVYAGIAERKITTVYLSDERGNEVSTDSSTFFTVEMKVGYKWGSTIDNSSAFMYDLNLMKNKWRNLNIYSLELAAYQTFIIGNINYSNFNVNKESYLGRFVPQTEQLVKSSHTDGDITLTYAAYETNELLTDQGKNPLIVWLHGMAEGGTDVDIALLGNQVTNLMEENIQSYFKTSGLKGAYVLVVQTPTMWMDSGGGISFGDQSKYTEPLMDTITTYIEENTDIDGNRIYLGGASNGGYMTLNMLFHYPHFFAAAFPIAEAYSDKAITDEMINQIKQIPIWFIHSQDDSVVPARGFVLPTYIRLIQAGAENVHLSYFENVYGLDAEGTRYMGHWSWVYPLQDRTVFDQDKEAILIGGLNEIEVPSSTPVIVDGDEVSLWGWIARQVNN